ncbi:(Fe-S)-binding protein [Paenibacillus eucommiae]|uniref:Glycolate oxidase iron-sulfur subunit n=1 Tax=Paenibacillus eucommiae TaxID=1355755 RepID=A0ABS4J0E3_9BACL|nr:(Fe-S)-binding protein [Paenibacillus eucommiae]MBP1993270.1 glycolate oxidase iron-sulfur subunit [Paenibacillus eucommiae]
MNATELKRPALKSQNPLAQHLNLQLDYDQLTNCMRCGFCLPACPTFRETGVEAESPRGRIALMKAVADGLMEPDKAFQEQMDHCLGCRACEPACPADVKYGQLLEQARDTIEDHADHKGWVKLLRSIAFKQLFPYQKRMRMLGFSLKMYQKGLRGITHSIGIMKLFPKHMQAMEKILPDASSKGVIERMGTDFYPAKGTPIARVGMFRGCIMDMLFTETNVNTVKLLSEAGFDVVIPKSQNCCGALHAHSGEMDLAEGLAQKNIRAFREANVDYIISNAGGCGAALIEYDHWLHDDSQWQEDAKWFASRVIDISQVIVEHGRIPQFAALPAESSKDHTLKITYQDSCHLRNVMRSSQAPRRLMQSVDNVQFVEAKESDRCCGSAGIYNVTQPKMAGDILAHKMEHVNKTEAHYLLTSNPGCLLQMKLGVEEHGKKDQMKAMHIVDFLYERTKA